MQSNILRSLTRKAVLATTAMLLCMPAESMAQTVHDLWLAMPDSIVPLLTAKQRADLIDTDNIQHDIRTTNAMGGKSQAAFLNATCLQVALTQSSTLQLGVLPTADGDTLACLVRTYNGPKSESTVTLYTPSWQAVDTLTFCIDDFVQRPDTMTETRYKELIASLDPYFFSAELSQDARTLTVTPHAAALGTDEEASVEAIFFQRKYNWDGHKFN